MQAHLISARNTSAIIALITMSNLLMNGFGSIAQDMWLAVIAAAAFSVPPVLIYCRLARLYPGKCLYDISEVLLGKWACRIAALLFTCYFFYIGVIVARNFSEFIATISLMLTPKLLIILCLVATSAYLAMGGFYNIGRWAIVVLVICTTNFVLTLISAFNIGDFTNLLPIMEHEPGEILSTGLSLFSSSFGEVIVAMTAFSMLKKGASPYKTYFGGVGLGFLILFFAAIRNAMVLGHGMMGISVFPSYITARIIRPDSFIEHIESIASFSLVLIGITKLAVCLRAAGMGCAKILNRDIKDKRVIIILAALMTIVCKFSMSNVQDLINFLEEYHYYSLVFIVVLPLVMWIIAEIKSTKAQKTA